jgi:hypothetical protein
MKKSLMLILALGALFCWGDIALGDGGVLQPCCVENAASEETQEEIRYTEPELEDWLDELGRQNTAQLVKQIENQPDADAQKRQVFNRKISAKVWREFKEESEYYPSSSLCSDTSDSAGGSELSFNLAQKMLGKKEWVTVKTEEISAVCFFSLNPQKPFDEFYLRLGSSYGAFYFFKKDRLLVKLRPKSHYGIDPEFWQDGEGKTVVWFDVNYTHGTGIWWNQRFFYKYDGLSFIPVLNLPQDVNQNGIWGFRNMRFESKILRTNPLEIEMQYRQSLGIPEADEDTNLVSGTTTIQYVWDKQAKKYRGNYDAASITEAQMLSYPLDNGEAGERLFIHAHYARLKALLANPEKRKMVLAYLQNVKAYYSKQGETSHE